MKVVFIHCSFSIEYRASYNALRNSARISVEKQLKKLQSQWDKRSKKTKKRSTRSTTINIARVMSLQRQLLIEATLPHLLDYWLKEGTNERFLAGDFKVHMNWDGTLLHDSFLYECLKSTANVLKFQALDEILSICHKQGAMA